MQRALRAAKSLCQLAAASRTEAKKKHTKIRSLQLVHISSGHRAHEITLITNKLENLFIEESNVNCGTLRCPSSLCGACCGTRRCPSSLCCARCGTLRCPSSLCCARPRKAFSLRRNLNFHHLL